MLLRAWFGVCVMPVSATRVEQQKNSLQDDALAISVGQLDVPWQLGQAAGLPGSTKVVLHGPPGVNTSLQHRHASAQGS